MTPIPPARPVMERCPCFAPFDDGLCAYCERPEADHDERAVHGPHLDPHSVLVTDAAVASQVGPG